MSKYAPGTDARGDDGFYTIPEAIPVPADFERRPLPSVTTIIHQISDFSGPDRWWMAEDVHRLAVASKEKRSVKIWNPIAKEMQEVHPGQVLLNQLDFDEWGRNYGLHHMKNGGARELERRGNRGSLIHDAALDFAFRDVRLNRLDLDDYTKTLLEARGYALPVEYCRDHVWNLMAWLDKYLDEVYFAEAMIVNWEYGYAGTFDMLCTLRNCGDLHPRIKPKQKNQLDFKGSKTWQPEHRMQAAAYKNSDAVILREYEGTDSVHEFIKPDNCINVYVREENVEAMLWGSDADLFSDDESLEDSFIAFTHLIGVFHHLQRANGIHPSKIKELCLAPPTSGQLDQYRTRHLQVQ